MCGIFCLKIDHGWTIEPRLVRTAATNLLKLAERRGKEAAGLAVLLPSGCYLLKQPTSASELIRSQAFDKMMERIEAELAGLGRTLPTSIALLGHARLVTNGKRAVHKNNQPFQSDRFVGVHNGIIINADRIAARTKPDVPTPELDSMSIAFSLETELAAGKAPKAANESALAAMEGIASYILFDTTERTVHAATNNGSLHLGALPGIGEVLVSERQMLKDFQRMRDGLAVGDITPISPGTALYWPLETSPPMIASGEPWSRSNLAGVTDFSLRKSPEEIELRRCTRCLLPETMPFVKFDAAGVCNWCHDNAPAALRPPAELERRLGAVRRKSRPNCLVAISGGRDSCYGLHVVKEVLGLEPVAFTYDWGMVTDIARRNTSRLCAKLAVEHILVSADIDRKRDNVRKNVEAWLKKPDLGTVPIFTAGDKQFYYHANRLKKELGVDIVIFCENGRLEKTWFKAGFCGINEGSRRLWNISLMEKTKLAAYYGRAFLTNPAYINSSLADTFSAYVSSYFLDHDYLQLFDYIDWREDEVERVLTSLYGWEFAPDATTSWRIGDGTAPFYNYIYLTAAGFTEFDTFRSAQIRAGHIDRATGLARIREDNRPRFEAIRDYLNVIGVNFDRALRAINSMPRLYN